MGPSPATPPGTRKQRAVFLLAIGLIAIAALAIRVVRLAEIPNGLHVDEASIGYNAKCVLETGRDEHGVFLPVYFEAFGEFKNPVFVYAAVPVIGLLGLDTFSVRFTSALFGAMTVFVTGLLGTALLNRWCGVIAALLLAVSPWHFQFSRIAFEAISLPLFVVLALWLLIESEHRPRRLVAAAIPLAIATYCYAVAKLFIPLLLIGFVVIRWRWLVTHRRQALIAGALLFALLLPNVVLTVQDRVQARFDRLSIGTNETSLAKGRSAVEASILGRHGPDWIRESRAIAVAAVFLGNYGMHLSPDFLVSSGDSNPRHNPGGGMLCRTEFGAAFIGVVALCFGFRRWPNSLMLWWLVIAPVPASLTALGIPHGVRTICLLPLPQILAAVGICTAVSIEQRWWSRLSSKWRRSENGSETRSSWAGRVPLITVLAIAAVWPADVGKHMTWYFEVFPVEVWRPFFWEENTVARLIADHDRIDRVFIGENSQSLFDITLLFVLDVPPRKWLFEHRLDRVIRRAPAPSELDEGSAVICRPGDPRYQHLEPLDRRIDPQGRPSLDLRISTDHPDDG